jgi:hypothetical protein
MARSDGLTLGIFPEAVLTDPDLTSLQKLVVVALGILIDRGRTGHCWPSHQYIADMIGSSRQKVQKALKGLEKRGWIEVDDDRRRRCKIYSFNMAICAPMGSQQSVQSEPHRGQDSGEAAQSEPSGAHRNEPNGAHNNLFLTTSPPYPPEGGNADTGAGRAGDPAPPPQPPAPMRGGGSTAPVAGEGGSPIARQGGEAASSWARVQSAVAAAIGPDAYRSWFAAVRLNHLAEGRAVLAAPSTFIRDRLASGYSENLKSACARHLGATEVVLTAGGGELAL